MLYNLSCSVKPGIIPALTQLPNNSKKKKKRMKTTIVKV